MDDPVIGGGGPGGLNAGIYAMRAARKTVLIDRQIVLAAADGCHASLGAAQGVEMRKAGGASPVSEK